MSLLIARDFESAALTEVARSQTCQRSKERVVGSNVEDVLDRIWKMILMFQEASCQPYMPCCPSLMPSKFSPTPSTGARNPYPEVSSGRGIASDCSTRIALLARKVMERIDRKRTDTKDLQKRVIRKSLGMINIEAFGNQNGDV
jgi:hypothetical protein